VSASVSEKVTMGNRVGDQALTGNVTESGREACSEATYGS
jgi:hypothetical protein